MPRKIILLVLLLAIMTIKPVSSFGQDKVEIKIGLLPVVESLPLVIAASQPKITTADFTVKFEVFSTWTALEAAYRTGMIDLAAMTAPKAIKLASKSIPLKILMGLHRNGNMLVTSFDPTKAENFKGKLIGVSGNDTGQLLLLAKFTKDKGIVLGAETRYIPIPQSKALELLENERIQGFLLSEPYGTMAIKRGLVKQSVTGAQIQNNFKDIIIIANPQSLKDYSSQIRLILSVTKEAGKIIDDDIRKSGAKQISLTQLDVLGIPAEIVQSALTNSNSKIKYDDMSISKSDLQEIERRALALGILDTSTVLDDFVD